MKIRMTKNLQLRYNSYKSRKERMISDFLDKNIEETGERHRDKQTIKMTNRDTAQFHINQ